MREGWVATEGVVTSCRFQFARMNTFRLGVQAGEKFRITFDYYAHGRLYSDEFQSAVAVAQDERIVVSYNPLRPGENSRSSVAGSGGSSMVVGVVGSVVLSLVWLVVLRGCW